MSRVSVPLNAVSSTEPHPVTLSWVLRRTVLGILILTSAVGIVAWLTYSSIDPAPAALNGASSEKTASSAY